MVKQVQKLLNAQCDILSPQALEAVNTALRDTRVAIDANADKEALGKQMARLEEAAAKWIKPYPNAEWRENIEVFLVAIVVAMGIRTFFLQPFKIPTGSMEPTLYGIEPTDLRSDPDFKMPGPLTRFWDAIYAGTMYHQIIAEDDGQVAEDGIGRLEHVLGFINKQTIYVKYNNRANLVPYTIWCGPDGRETASGRATGIDTQFIQPVFHKGEPILQFKETAGDHLFVDRISYNFRHPQRGDIIVFQTRGIDHLNPDQFYIKRLIGLPGDTVSIGDDQHVRINGQRLDASTPHFANVYGFDPNAPRREGSTGQYNGHVLEPLDPRCLLKTPSDSITVQPGHFAVFGDNTLNSWDSRYWGDFPEGNVIGKSFFVYWPITKRFGWGQN